MNITSEQVQRYSRIFIYWAMGALATHGVSVSGSLSEIIASGFVTIANIAWTIYGGRLMARINELAKSGQVQEIVVKDKDVAQAAPSNKVTST